MDKVYPLNRFISYRILLHSLIKRAKFGFYKRKIEDANGDTKQFWSVVNEVAGRPTAKELFPVQGFSLQGEPVTLNSNKDLQYEYVNLLNHIFLR